MINILVDSIIISVWRIYTMAQVIVDPKLSKGLEYLKSGKRIDYACKLINQSAKNGITPGKSFFAIGEILRKGIVLDDKPGLEPKVEESKAFYDQAITEFLKTSPDAMDYLEMGDYFNYGLGTEPVNKVRALEYYDFATNCGDSTYSPIAAQKAAAIRRELQNGSAEVAPVLEKTNEAQVVSPTLDSSADSETHEEASKVEDSDSIVPPQASPVDTITNNGNVLFNDIDKIKSSVDGDLLLVKGIRLLDSPASNEADLQDGVTLINSAEAEGSLRASVLLGYLYEGNTSILNKDYDESKRHYEIAIGKGSAVAEYRLGLLYLNKDASFYSQERGHELIISSARHGYTYALNYLGDSFRIKVSNSKNLELAYRYYALAGERGLGIAYHKMAEIDASRQEFELAKVHEKYAFYHGYDKEVDEQDPLFFSLHI